MSASPDRMRARSPVAGHRATEAPPRPHADTSAHPPARRSPRQGARADSARSPSRDSLRRRMLAAADTMAAIAAVGALAVLAGGGPAAITWGLAAVPLWILLAKLHGLYERDHRSLRYLTADEIGSIFLWSLGGTAVTVLLLAGVTASVRLDTAAVAWLIAGCAAFVFRAVARAFWRRIVPPERAVVVGVGPLANAVRRKFELFPDIHIELRGAREECGLADLNGNSGWLEGADRVILASQTITEEGLTQLLSECRRRGVRLSVVPPARGMFGTAVQLNHVAELPVVEYNTWDVSRSTLLLKRALDLFAASVAMVALAPLFVLAAIAVRAGSPGPVLFTQWRAGQEGRPFRMYKFRTMSPDAEGRLGEFVSLDQLEEPMFKLRSDPRITRIGAFLRRTSLDELPQLLNVLRGEMSLVGPRPEQVELVARYGPEHLFRLSVKPGITGPMQVYGRGELSFDERLAVERDYIENLSLARDLRMLVLTFAAVFHGRGAF
jgi:exopolysaccharide biosynthesis polyprenyl glycosylphosphotransferase